MVFHPKKTNCRRKKISVIEKKFRHSQNGVSLLFHLPLCDLYKRTLHQLNLFLIVQVIVQKELIFNVVRLWALFEKNAPLRGGHRLG